MRGKLVDIVVWVVGLRITPAHAGKTTPVMPEAVTTADHPRACGENVAVVGTSADDAGSPPRMRGKLPRPKLGKKR